MPNPSCRGGVGGNDTNSIHSPQLGLAVLELLVLLSLVLPTGSGVGIIGGARNVQRARIFFRTLYS